MTNLDLLGKDYYSHESAVRYWSISQYKRFRECEARALSELQGNWSDTRDNTALLVGNYVHSYFESKEAHSDFIDANKGEIISKSGKTKGQLKSDFKIADLMIQRLKQEEDFTKFYQGDKEVAITGFIKGVEFKGKIDCLNIAQGYFVDIKTTKGPIDSTVWVENQETGYNERIRWFEAWGYVLQMAAYKQMLEEKYEKTFTPIIYAVTKEEQPDVRAIVFKSQDKLNASLSDLEQSIIRLDKVKRGIATALPCGRCDYCRANKLTQKVEVW